MNYKGYLIEASKRGFFYVMRNSNYTLYTVDTVEQAKEKIDALVGA